MKIVFIVPAAPIRRTALYRIGGAIYGHSSAITGPLILGRILKEKGYNVEVYEELNHDVNYSLCCADADIIGIYTMTSCALRAYELADFFRRQRKRVIIGGIHASSCPEEAICHADQVIVGEGERVIADVVSGKLTTPIVYSPSIRNLDIIPFPDYHLLKTPCDSANVMTTRGCPFACSFCTTSRMFHPYRERSIENVIEELRGYKKAGFQYMNFEDDNFTANKERAKQLLRRMLSEGLIFKETFFFGRTDLARDEELLQLLQQAHLNRVLIGIESLNQKSLDSVHKKQQVIDIKQCSQVMKKYKIRVIASIVLGLDNDSIEDMRRNVRFCRHIHAYQLQPAILTPFPGTPIHQQFVSEHRMITHDWSRFDMMHVTFMPKQLSAKELQKEFFRAIAKFYSFSSSFTIMKIFGLESGFRRLGLWIISRIGLLLLHLDIRICKNNYFHLLQ
ncbi:MAG: B12-binding domain-containing radical SAM protein [Megasphaera sp.]|jgi:radical SAM superfamily enzyme YgiQ (UPF0313 family)|uniref:B12-binding domain-containing radical SAM protein n=1 Tax=Megasphaera sueciensis TaxID=349094 RepID=UPI003D005B90|nr:B12-binding domain-containing radical SAM protein [Megasphaera sp.]MCI1822619.1 B12-binding domain-containing radical SAM protein [Megasphaera sp.]